METRTMHRTHTIARRAAVLLALSALLLCGLLPDGRGVAAQSGRKIPEKARKDQPEAPPGATTPAGQPKANSPTTPPPPPLKPGELQGAIQLGVDVVNVETVVYNKKSGQILQGLKKENFEVYEDGVKQEITNFTPSEGPLTMVFVIEFVTQVVKPGDNIAIVAFDMRPFVVADFTGDPKQLRAGMQFLFQNYPAFSESNLFDTLAFVIQGGKVDNVEYNGLKGVQGRSAIVLISLGVDTFSKINYDDIRNIVAHAGIPIYTVGVGNLMYKLLEPYMRPEEEMTWQQAFNTLRTFSRMTGGQYFPITFAGEIPTSMQSIANLMRNQYSIGYEPTNTRHEGKTRKIVVKVDVDGDGKPDDKEYVVQHRESYIEPLDTPRK